jgi:hypothetical protein
MSEAKIKRPQVLSLIQMRHYSNTLFEPMGWQNLNVTNERCFSKPTVQYRFEFDRQVTAQCARCATLFKRRPKGLQRGRATALAQKCPHNNNRNNKVVMRAVRARVWVRGGKGKEVVNKGGEKLVRWLGGTARYGSLLIKLTSRGWRGTRKKKRPETLAHE